jgi:polyphosphate kinase 2 (PPK2 family)
MGNSKVKGKERDRESSGGGSGTDATASPLPKLPKKVYAAELLRLQEELVKMAEWVKTSGERIVVIFEGRDAAGKGGAIKRITDHLNPRIARVVALPVPSERQATQWYFQRYVEQLPAGGEIVLFDRSWYNRAGIEKVLGFCSNVRSSSGFSSPTVST